MWERAVRGVKDMRERERGLRDVWEVLGKCERCETGVTANFSEIKNTEAFAISISIPFYWDLGPIYWDSVRISIKLRAYSFLSMEPNRSVCVIYTRTLISYIYTQYTRTSSIDILSICTIVLHFGVRSAVTYPDSEYICSRIGATQPWKHPGQAPKIWNIFNYKLWALPLWRNINK